MTLTLRQLTGKQTNVRGKRSTIVLREPWQGGRTFTGQEHPPLTAGIRCQKYGRDGADLTCCTAPFGTSTDRPLGSGYRPRRFPRFEVVGIVNTVDECCPTAVNG